VIKQRGEYRKRRKLNQAFQIAIVGYTNAGKSTLFNRLTNESSLEENLLFATLDPLTRKIHLPSGFECLLTDTVGFLQDLPTSLIAAFKSTLEEATEADFLIHVVDASNEGNMGQQKTVTRILKELDADTIPTLTVYNKKDLLNTDFFKDSYPSMLISTFEDEDVERLLHKLEETIKEEWEFYTISLEPHEGRTMHQLGKHSIIIKKYYNETTNQYEIEGYIQKEHPLQGVIKGANETNDR
jgi:GTP-binding protein HflX